MWILTHVATNKNFYIKQNKTSLGRKGQDIELVDDLSLSRVHAHLILTDGDVLTVVDAKSKYGTYLNERRNEPERLPSDKETKLNDGDRIMFGRISSEFIVQQVQMKTVVSMIASVEKKDRLEILFNALKVKTADAIDSSCSHLTMPAETTVSQKLLHALVRCIPVVTPNYWMGFQECIAKNLPLPKAFDFVPKIKQDAYLTPGSVSLALNPDRKKLFLGKTFIFVSKSQLLMYEEIIKKAGGKVVNLSENKLTVSSCCAKSAIVVQVRSESQSQNEAAISKISAALAQKMRRMVIDHEIGLAVLHASIEKYCNPDDLDTKLFEANSSLLKPATTDFLIDNTENHPQNMVAPSTSSGRLKRTATATKVSAIIDLDSDDENDQNEKASALIVNDKKTQASIQSILIPETQSTTNEGTQMPIQDESSNDAIMMSSVDETVESIPTTLSNIKSLISTSTRATRASKRQASQALTETSPSKFTRSKQTTLNSSDASSSGLFNFTDTSMTDSLRNQRKRKTPDDSDDSILSKFNKRVKKPDPKPTSTRTRKNKIIDEDSEEEIQPATSRMSRKRNADKAMGSDGGLFNFNTSFVKKLKPTEIDSSQNQTSSGIVPASKPPSPSPSTVSKLNDSYESCDSSVWLSKKLHSVNIDESVDGIKVETEPLVCTEDIKPQNLPSLFDVVDTTTTTTSSMISLRKPFFKKQNFKPQTKVVAMKVFMLEDTRVSLDFVD